MEDKAHDASLFDPSIGDGEGAAVGTGGVGVGGDVRGVAGKWVPGRKKEWKEEGGRRKTNNVLLKC